MEQIQIRQPKMPVAQSFIQILGTYLASLFIFIVAYFSYIKNGLFNLKTAKTFGNTWFSLKKANFIYQRGKYQRVMKLRIWSFYYVLLIFRYISFSSHEKEWFVFWNQENLVFSLLNIPSKSFYVLSRWMKEL